MEKIYKNREIFKNIDYKKPIPFKEYKDIVEDDDFIFSGFDEGFYQENNSIDAHYFVSIVRLELETDEEFKERKQKIKREIKESKERRYKSYLKLKKEFEN